jgi:hypothetical protein
MKKAYSGVLLFNLGEDSEKKPILNKLEKISRVGLKMFNLKKVDD